MLIEITNKQSIEITAALQLLNTFYKRMNDDKKQEDLKEKRSSGLLQRAAKMEREMCIKMNENFMQKLNENFPNQ